MKEITHGNTSWEVRKSKDGKEYFYQSWMCTWKPSEIDTAQMRTLIFWKHPKFQNTYTVTVQWLCLTSFQYRKDGQPRAISHRERYRVNLKTGTVLRINRGRLHPVRSEYEFVGAGLLWEGSKLKTELRIMTQYAETMWSTQNKLNEHYAS